MEPASCLAYFSSMKMEAAHSFMSVNYLRTSQHHITLKWHFPKHTVSTQSFNRDCPVILIHWLHWYRPKIRQTFLHLIYDQKNIKILNQDHLRQCHTSSLTLSSYVVISCIVKRQFPLWNDAIRKRNKYSSHLQTEK